MYKNIYAAQSPLGSQEFTVSGKQRKMGQVLPVAVQCQEMFLVPPPPDADVVGIWLLRGIDDAVTRSGIPMLLLGRFSGHVSLCHFGRKRKLQAAEGTV